MAFLRFLGIDLTANGQSILGRPGTDQLLIDDIRPSGGASGPLQIIPAAQVTAGNSLLIVEDGNGAAILSIDVTAGAGSTTLEGDLTVTGNLSVTGANTVSGGPSTVNTNITFGDDATDTVTFARSWTNGTDLSYSSSLILDPGGSPTFGTDGSPHIVAATDVDPTTFGTNVGGFNPPVGSLMLQTGGTAYIKDGVGVTAWSPLLSGVSLQVAYDGGNAIDTSTSAQPVAISQSGTLAPHDLLTVTKTPSGATAGRGISVEMSANCYREGIDINHYGTGTGLRVESLLTGDVVQFIAGVNDEIFSIDSLGEVRITPGPSQKLSINMDTHGTDDTLDIRLDNTVNSFIDVSKSFSAYTGFGTTLGAHYLDLQQVGGASEEVGLYMFGSDPNGTVFSPRDGSLGFFGGDWFIKNGDAGTVWDQIATGASGVADLQGAYDGGDTIDVTAFNPVEITDNATDSILLNLSRTHGTATQAVIRVVDTSAGGSSPALHHDTSGKTGFADTVFMVDSNSVYATRLAAGRLTIDQNFDIAADTAPASTLGTRIRIEAGAGGSGLAMGGQLILVGGTGSINPTGAGGTGGFATIDGGSGNQGAAGFAGGTGGDILARGGDGGDANVGGAAGRGGTVGIRGGVGGDGSASVLSADGGDVDLDGGIPGADLGGGLGLEGYIKIAASTGRYVGIGNVTTGGNGFVEIDTSRTGTQGALAILPYNTGVGQTAEMRFFELGASGSSHVGFKAPDAISSNQIWTLPAVDAAGPLVSNGSGVLSFSTSAVTDLQTAYDGGNTIVATAASPIAFSNAVDATDLLTLDRTFAGGGRALDITMGSSTTAEGVNVTNVAGASGVLFVVDGNGSSADTFNVRDAGLNILRVRQSGAVDIGAATGNGSNLVITGSNTSGTTIQNRIHTGASGSNISITAGASSDNSTAANGGDVILSGGVQSNGSGLGGDGGDVTLIGGATQQPSRFGGSVDIFGGDAFLASFGTGGDVNINAGFGSVTLGTINIGETVPGPVNIRGVVAIDVAGEVLIAPDNSQQLSIDMNTNSAHEVQIRLASAADSVVAIQTVWGGRAGYGTANGGEFIRLEQIAGGTDIVGIYGFDSDPNGQVSAPNDGSLGFFSGDWFIKNGDGSTNWDQIYAGAAVADLQDAYDGGQVISTTTNGSVFIQNTGAGSVGQLLTINNSPTSADTSLGLYINRGVNATGDQIHVQNQGSARFRVNNDNIILGDSFNTPILQVRDGEIQFTDTAPGSGSNPASLAAVTVNTLYAKNVNKGWASLYLASAAPGPTTINNSHGLVSATYALVGANYTIDLVWTHADVGAFNTAYTVSCDTNTGFGMRVTQTNATTCRITAYVLATGAAANMGPALFSDVYIHRLCVN